MWASFPSIDSVTHVHPPPAVLAASRREPSLAGFIGRRCSLLPPPAVELFETSFFGCQYMKLFSRPQISSITAPRCHALALPSQSTALPFDSIESRRPVCLPFHPWHSRDSCSRNQGTLAQLNPQPPHPHPHHQTTDPTRMFDTFELHPLPEAALKALRAAAVADGCPEGMAIVGGLSEVSVD